jgi:transcriptional regulator with XRE-family HTH domain
MRSLRKTTVAVVREELGLGLQEFADLIGKSTSTVSSLENGRLKLSEPTALTISKKTGVSLKWLLDGDVSAPITNSNAEGWTIRAYEQGAAGTKMQYLVLRDEERFDALNARIRKLLEGQVIDPDRFIILVSRIYRFLDKLEKEFPPEPGLKATESMKNIEKAYAAPQRKSKTSSAVPSPASGHKGPK